MMLSLQNVFVLQLEARPFWVPKIQDKLGLNEAKRMSLFLSRLCLNVVLLENCNSLFKDASYGIDLGGEGGMVRLGINCCYKQILLITSHFWQSNKFCPNC